MCIFTAKERFLTAYISASEIYFPQKWLYLCDIPSPIYPFLRFRSQCWAELKCQRRRCNEIGDANLFRILPCIEYLLQKFHAKNGYFLYLMFRNNERELKLKYVSILHKTKTWDLYMRYIQRYERNAFNFVKSQLHCHIKSTLDLHVFFSDEWTRKT